MKTWFYNRRAKDSNRGSTTGTGPKASPAVYKAEKKRINGDIVRRLEHMCVPPPPLPATRPPPGGAMVTMTHVLALTVTHRTRAHTRGAGTRRMPST